ncbi:peptidyl-prolyl cis-trans isomerase [Nocardioides dubius]|uniref:peptidyl-prolyl cis-trans isomerase n=1 Tax=Nocardioides dubius TaxID=317019 RepID=UPI0031E31064
MNRLSTLRWERFVPRGVARWVVLAVVIVLVAGAGFALTRGDDDELADGDVLRVGDTSVTAEQLDDRIAALEALYGVTPPQEKEAAERFRRDAAKSYVMGLVVEAEAERRDIVIAEKQSRAELGKLIEERLAGDRAAFTRFLGDAQITEEMVLAEIGRTLATNRLYEQVVADVEDATLEQARTEYDARRDEMSTAEKRALSNIVVGTEAEAQAVLAELGKGTDFAKVAAATSQDTSTSGKGGALGTVEQADLDPTYAVAAFAARKGEPFGPTESEFGWNVGVVTKIVPGTPLSFEEVAPTLIAALTTKAQNDVWQRFLADLLADADAVYADDYQPENPTSAPSEAVEPEGADPDQKED